MVWLGHGARKRSPWAAMVSLVTPHYPLVAPKPWFDAVDPELIPGAIAPRAWPDHPELRRVRGFFDHDPHFDDPGFVAARRSYFGLVSFMDDCMGQVLGALEDSGQRDETLVLYISDHGEMLGDHGYWGKSVMYEASAGVPMVMAGPGVAPRRCETPVTLLDVATTALATFGLESDGLPGGDLWAIARVTDDAGRAAFSEYHDGGSTTGAFMVRWDRWKYVHYSGERAQLFDLEMDPQEMKDLGADPDFEAIRAEGLDRLSAICDPDAVNAAAHADQAQRLAAMGGKEAALQTAFSHTPIPGVKG
jgi:choline-sulfatase